MPCAYCTNCRKDDRCNIDNRRLSSFNRTIKRPEDCNDYILELPTERQDDERPVSKQGVDAGRPHGGIHAGAAIL